MARDNQELDEDLRDLLITISVIAKRLAKQLEAKEQPNEDLLDFGGNDNGEERTCRTTEQCGRDVF